jgi:hypothetical protein
VLRCLSVRFGLVLTKRKVFNIWNFVSYLIMVNPSIDSDYLRILH